MSGSTNSSARAENDGIVPAITIKTARTGRFLIFTKFLVSRSVTDGTSLTVPSCVSRTLLTNPFYAPASCPFSLLFNTGMAETSSLPKPSFFGSSPKAMPSICVKYMIGSLKFVPKNPFTRP